MRRPLPAEEGVFIASLIADGTTILTIITAALQHPACLIEENSLATPIRDTLITVGYEDMPHGCKGITHSRRDCPLECNPPPAHDAIARRFNGLLHVHGKIDHIERYLHMALDLHITAHHPVTQPWPLILQDHRWNDGLEGPLARRQYVRMNRISDKTRTTIL